MGEQDWGLSATPPASADPHELASWVNEIDELQRRHPAIQDPHELASWVNKIAELHVTPSTSSGPP